MNQLATIKEALELGLLWIDGSGRDKVREALTALAQLDAMVGEPGPVAWMYDWLPAGGPTAYDWISGNRAEVFAPENGYFNIRPLYATPPAQQQYEAGDMASAHNDGFRAGVASVVQRPQARPDFSDEWTGYLKDGETPFERFLRERKDLNALTKLYQRALEENERLKAQQAQADVVTLDTLYLLRRLSANRHAYSHSELADEMSRIVAEAQKAEAVPADQSKWCAYVAGVIGCYLKEPDDSAKVKAIAGIIERRMWAAPQQAEAVPPANLIDPGVVVSFAVDRWFAEVANRPLVNVHRRTLDDTWRQVIRRFGGDPEALLGPNHDAMIAAAQGEKP